LFDGLRTAAPLGAITPEFLRDNLDRLGIGAWQGSVQVEYIYLGDVPVAPLK
jgi:hypothetical protein